MTLFAIRDRPSPNHADRGTRPRVDMLVLHYTGMRSAAMALDRLCDPATRVSAHYLVDEDGAIWRLVPEMQRAFHAGLSCWQDERDLNLVSIGIEIVNPGHEWGYRPFPAEQIAAVEWLCRDVLSRHPIPPDRIVGHSDIAPERKTDPGELFDWPRLARAGVGIWPVPGRREAAFAVDLARAAADLAAIGYCARLGIETAAVIAFQRRFRPVCVDGIIDPDTSSRLAEVRTAFARSRLATDLSRAPS